MSAIKFDISSYFINDKDVSDKEFVDTVLSKLKNLITRNDSVEVTVDNEKLNLTKSSSFRDHKAISNKINDFIDIYPEYSLEDGTNGFDVYAIDNDDNSLDLMNVIGKKSEVVNSTDSSIVDVEDVVDVTALIPTLTNKSYNAFIDICMTTKDFLSDYKEIGQLHSFLFKKTTVNSIAKAIFAPIKAWDYVGAECKMKKEEFDLLKSNLVQFSEDDVCVDLGSYSWIDVFNWMKERRTVATKFIVKNNSFVAKIKTNVIDVKTKQSIGKIIVTLSVVVDESVKLNKKIGELSCYKSNISINMIAR